MVRRSSVPPRWVLPLLALAFIGLRVAHIPAQSAGDPRRPDGLAIAAVDLRHGWDDAGVQQLVRAIGDARIVMLGEPWHGDGAAIRVRAELVRLLHEHLGFDVLAFEADFYSLDRGWAALGPTQPAHAFAVSNIYHFWSRSAAAAPLWDYIESQRRSDRPLDVAGVDIRHVGAVARATLPEELDRRLAALPYVTTSQRGRFRSLLVRLLEHEWGPRPDTTEQREFLALLDAMETAEDRDAGRHRFEVQEVRNLRHAAQFAWQGANRDHGMGENLAWLASHRYPGRKIIVWAHNNHLITDKWMYFAAPDSTVRRGLAGWTLDDIATATYLGHEARQYFGPDVFSLALVSNGGRYTMDVRTENLQQRGDFGMTRPLDPAPAGTIESTVAALGHGMAFVDFRASSRKVRSARVLDYVQSPPLALDYAAGFDGLLYLGDTFGLDETPGAKWPGSPPNRSP